MFYSFICYLVKPKKLEVMAMATKLSSMMKRFFAISLCSFTLIFVSACKKENINIAKDGNPLVNIIIADCATEIDNISAKELKLHLDKITGGNFEIKKESEVSDDASAIHIGNTTKAKTELKNFDSKSAAYDSLIIKTVGKNLYLNGHYKRGSYYAVCEFLEREFGVKWWTGTESYIPTLPTISLKHIDYSYAPKFISRTSSYFNAFPTVFNARQKNSMFSPRLYDSIHSDIYSVGCHSYYRLLPPEKYFKDHPEWYSYKAKTKKRFHEHGQLCLSNDEMAKEFLKNAIELINKKPHAKYVHVSQNDWGGDCECPKCLEIKNKFGGMQSGINVWFANKIAKELEKQFPEIAVVTFAYQQTRKAPQGIKPAKNVYIQLCSIECDFAHPLETDTEFGFTKDLKEWCAITDNLFIWNYVALFWNYAIPHPNMNSLAKDLKFFLRNGGKGIFEQGDSQCNIGNFCDMRAYLIHKLMWNPDLNQKEIEQEFLKGYYGKEITPLLAEYLDIINDTAESTNYAQHCYFMDTLTWLDVRNFDKCLGLMQSALKTAKRLEAENPTKYKGLTEKIERVKISIDLASSINYLELKELAKQEKYEMKNLKNPVETTKNLLALFKKFKTKTIRENASPMFESQKKLLEKSAKIQLDYEKNPPKKSTHLRDYKKAFGHDNFVEYEELYFNYINPTREVRQYPLTADIFADDKASNGYAVATPLCETRQHQLTIPLRFDLAKLYKKSGLNTPDATFVAYAYMRLKSPQKKGAYIVSLLSNLSAKNVFAYTMDADKKLITEEYQLIKLGEFAIKDINKNLKSLSTYKLVILPRKMPVDSLLIDSVAIGIKQTN